MPGKKTEPKRSGRRKAASKKAEEKKPDSSKGPEPSEDLAKREAAVLEALCPREEIAAPAEPERSADLARQANAAMVRRAYAEAERLAAEAVSLAAENEEAGRILGNARHQNARSTTVLQRGMYSRELAEGQRLLKAGDTDGADAALERALRSYQEGPEAHALRGDIAHRREAWRRFCGCVARIVRAALAAGPPSKPWPGRVGNVTAKLLSSAGSLAKLRDSAIVLSRTHAPTLAPLELVSLAALASREVRPGVWGALLLAPFVTQAEEAVLAAQ